MPINPQPRQPPRPLYQPGPDFNRQPIPVTRQPQRIWFRVHRSGSPAVQFGLRPHHRFSHASCPFPLLYLGPGPSACLWEYFGDDVFGGRHVIAASKWNACSLSQIKVPQLSACAVSLEPTRNAMGVDKASLLAADLSLGRPAAASSAAVTNSGPRADTGGAPDLPGVEMVGDFAASWR